MWTKSVLRGQWWFVRRVKVVCGKDKGWFVKRAEGGVWEGWEMVCGEGERNVACGEE